MLVKTLSVQQPYASMICYGVKAVENRSWKTDYRGRILIHASGGAVSFFDDRSASQQRTLQMFE
ncbi:MAG: ASCH domain-containing protein [Treponema sp.]|nr:ASCH domain-containing protein [Treponema sp.]